MVHRPVWIALVVATTLWWSNSCCAQAFFPLLRVDDTAYDTTVRLKLNSGANNRVDVTETVDGPAIDHDDYLTIINEASTAVDGDSLSISSGIAEAQILPLVDCWMMSAECIASIGGAWVLDASETGYAGFVNNQFASSSGSVEILPNPSYPEVTLGELQVTFTIVPSSVAWDTTYLYMSCGNSSIFITFDGAYYTAEGYLEGYGSIEESDIFGAPLVYTATQNVEVSEVIQATAEVNGEGTGAVFFGDSESELPGLSAAASFYVTER